VSEETTLPLVDEERIRAIFSELEGMEVELDPDPLQFGPKRLNAKIAYTRGMLTRCERVFLQVSHDLQFYKRTHRSAQLDFDLQMQDFYANDPEVRAGRNVKDREALATMKLREEREALMDMEVGIQDLEMVMSVVKAKRADLRDIQGRLRDQLKLCQEEVGLGSRWGSRPPPGMTAPDIDAAPRTDPKALADMQELVISTSDAGEVHLSAGDESWMEDGEDHTETLRKLKEDVAALDEETPEEDSEDEIVMPGDSIDEETVVATAAAEESGDNDLADILDFTEPEEDGQELPPVTSDEEVDGFFARLDAPKAPKKDNPKAAPAEAGGEDLDNLIAMFD